MAQRLFRSPSSIDLPKAPIPSIECSGIAVPGMDLSGEGFKRMPTGMRCKREASDPQLALQSRPSRPLLVALAHDVISRLLAVV
jgi:hypothetical protein